MSSKHVCTLTVLLFGTCLCAQSGYMGVAFVKSPPESPVRAVMIGWINPGGPAEAAGLQVGDLIKDVDGHAVDTPHAAQMYVLSRKPGDVLSFDVLRQTPAGYRENRVKVTLGALNGGKATRADDTGNQPPATRVATGSASAAPVAAGAASSATISANIRYRRYVDPAEQAFDDMVPEGWRVGGRLVRYGPVSIAPFVQAISPDGAIFIQLGDWHIQDFADIPGWKDGSVYTPGTSVNLVRRVQDATGYARSYGLNFEKWLGCEKSEFVNAEAAQTPAGLPTVPQSRVETSLAHFTCERGGQRYVAQVMTTVQSYRLPMSIGWNVLYLASMLAREDLAGTGIAVWNKMRTSIRFLPEWNAKESAIAGQATRPAQAALDSALRQTQQFDENVINGSITVHDPTTGAQSEIPIGVSPYYFADGNGHYYSSYDPVPRLGFHGVQAQH